ncbi:MAG TPA: ABC transporter ATP-binding protein [Terriglobales bacterium]|nr:ABC transporter ATP-binding protein [Terriglobales bacterium]
MQPVLEFEGATKVYNRFFGARRVAALDQLSLTVDPGEIFGFLGPNGAGKTTAIHLAMGFMRPTSGRGHMLGQPFGHAPTRMRVGFLAENVAFYYRPAEQLVRFYGGLNDLPRSVLKQRAGEVLDAVGLGEHARRNAGKFSRGMLQRVGLAQALVNDPELLILDEPTSALDPIARVTVRELLLQARNAGKTVFLSSHLLSEVELICDRIGVLNKGRLVALGKTADLLHQNGNCEIQARNVPLREFAGAVIQNGLLRIAVPVAAQRATVERIWAAGGEVISVMPMRRTLEDLFLELTAGKMPREGVHATSAADCR